MRNSDSSPFEERPEPSCRSVVVTHNRPTVCTLPRVASQHQETATHDGRIAGPKPTRETGAEPTPLRIPTAAPEMAFHHALSACHDYPGQRFFQDRTEHRLAVLTPAYRLALEIVCGGEPAFDLAVSRMPAGLRQRAPSREKPELLALQIAAKPETANQRKQCSALASLLMVARVKGLSAEAFPEWAADADLEECRTKAKRIRAALRAGVAPDLDDESASAEPDADAPWVQVIYGRGTKTIEAYPAPLPPAAETGVAALIRAGVAAGTLPTVLRRIADFLDGVGGAEQALPVEVAQIGKAPTVAAPVQTSKPGPRPISPRDILRDDSIAF